MHVVVGKRGGVGVENLEIFTDFAVHAPSGFEIDCVGKALESASIGEIAGGRAWISSAAVTRLAGALGVSDDWYVDFGAMLGYARGKGWVRADGAIRAHIEYY